MLVTGYLILDTRYWIENKLNVEYPTSNIEYRMENKIKDVPSPHRGEGEG